MIVLVGFMGCGKTTVGRALASRLGLPFTDVDELVEAGAGRSIAHIFDESGEGQFRRLEWEALLSLEGAGSRVVATGGGLFLGAEHRRWIRERGTSVWLDVPLDVCAARVARQGGRPLWPSAETATVRELFEKRRAAYALATLCLALREEAPEEAAGRIEERLRERGVVFR